MITEEFRNLWPFDFSLVYTVSLTANNIETGLRVHNIGDRAFDFNTLLHTYFLIPVRNVFSHVVFVDPCYLSQADLFFVLVIVFFIWNRMLLRSR